ncbi:hypothetical protein GCM10010377_11770 [Streptomyces viridiviolaceus]|uniref:Uncharacterized protein n=1 Tax=Streptomyces viridiviolaceus TaxID=68282 RepID=A0ABW2DYQ4_9ACTN|nr:hypothetical protein [Streptomyces viridiviolaceus]GHB23339.1 hypothetical protein GCM10010377_11770 [Streptomyces viridiviolaceus]
MAAEHPGGEDALMAAITGEPLPPEARTDTGLLAEYRSAEADVALLREQLQIIGRTLGAPPAEAEPTAAVHRAPVRARRRRPLALALGALAVTCAGAMVTGLGWLTVQGGGASDDAAKGAAASDARQDSADSGPAVGSPLHLACSRLVAEGTVTGVEPGAGAAGQRVTVRLTRSYKPAKPETDEITFVQDEDTAAPLRPGDHTLVSIPRHAAAPDAVLVGEDDIAPVRARITASLPESRTLTCE